ncbi:MAG: hypothetical protein AAGA77_24815 [Bacteroidota bacterium]
MKEPRWICITGLDGAGKSSLVKNILEDKEWQGQKVVREVTIWDYFTLPPEERFLHVKSKLDVDNYLGRLDTVSRSYFLLHCLAHSVHLARKSDVDIAILNGYWYKYMASEVAYGGDREKLVKWAEILPEPETIFVLNIPISTAAERKEFFSGYESGFPNNRDKKAFAKFQVKVHDAFDEIMKNKKTHSLNGEKTLNELKNEVLNYF